MKYIGPNAYSQITDLETGAIVWQLDLSSEAIEYTNQDLENALDKKVIPPDLGEFDLHEIRKIRKEYENIKKFCDANPNLTPDELREWSKNRDLCSKEEIIKKHDLLDYLIQHHERLKYTLEANTETFAIPSHSLMFSLLAMFAGKPERIPRALLDKPHHERTPTEKARAEKYLSAIFQTEQEIDFSEANVKVFEKRIAFICDNSKVEAKAEINMALFRHDLSFREERLALYIKRTFGSEGIRHFLGLIIGLEENYRKGSFAWSVNEHLERLGYRRKANGSFDPKLKKMASEILKIFTGLCITSTRKDGKSESIKAKFLFMVEGFEIQTFEKEIISEKITLVATDFWYKNAFSPVDGYAPQYTKLLKEIVCENHREHPLTLYLAPLLAIFWRMHPERKMRVLALMEWCDLDTSGKNRSTHLHSLESTLEYMIKKGYLGDWSCSGEAKFPSDCINPYGCVLTLIPPLWLKSELALIAQKREVPAFPDKRKRLTRAEFMKIFEASGLNRKQFANSIGVTPQLITAIINGKRPITSETSDKVRLFTVHRKKQTETKTTSLKEESTSLNGEIDLSQQRTIL